MSRNYRSDSCPWNFDVLKTRIFFVFSLTSQANVCFKKIKFLQHNYYQPIWPRQKRSTVEPPVNDHPKCQGQLVAYKRWSLTRAQTIIINRSKLCLISIHCKVCLRHFRFFLRLMPYSESVYFLSVFKKFCYYLKSQFRDFPLRNVCLIYYPGM